MRWALQEGHLAHTWRRGGFPEEGLPRVQEAKEEPEKRSSRGGEQHSSTNLHWHKVNRVRGQDTNLASRGAKNGRKSGPNETGAGSPVKKRQPCGPTEESARREPGKAFACEGAKASNSRGGSGCSVESE